MRRIVTYAIVGVALAACAFLLFGCAAPSSQVHCLPLPTYSPSEQVQLAVELTPIPERTMVRRALEDYERMRDADRACMGAKP